MSYGRKKLRKQPDPERCDMARVTDVVLRKPPMRPGEYATQKEALEANPKDTVVDAVFSSEQSAREAAFRVNGGERKKWPSDRYYAIWDYNKDADGDTEDGGEGDMIGRWELLIGIKEHMPKGWVSVVNAPGSRKGRGSTSDASDEASGTDEQGDSDDVAEESAHGEGFFA